MKGGKSKGESKKADTKLAVNKKAAPATAGRRKTAEGKKPIDQAAGYLIFMEKYMKENPRDNKSMSIVSPMVSWNQLSEAEKAQYTAIAAKDLEREREYEEILSIYTKNQDVGPAIAAMGKKPTIAAIGKKIDPSIQKAASGYLIFMEKYRKENPDKTKSISIVNKPTVLWKQLSEAEKAQYAAKAEERKLEYEEILSAYTKNIMSSSPSSTEPSSPPLSLLPIENIASRYYLLTGKLYPSVPVLRPPPPPPTSSFNVPQRPSKPQPCKIIPHPLIPGVYVAGDHYDRKDDVESLFLYTRNLVPGVQSHDEDVLFSVQNEDGSTMEYREWDPFKSRFAAAILSDAQDISIKPGSRVLVLNSRDDTLFGMTISHISDIVGPQGMVYVVEEASRSLLTMASKRFNIVPIVYGVIPHKYRMLINVVDVLFAALDSPKEVREAFLNATYFLKTGGKYLVYVQGTCNEPSNQGDSVFSYLLKGERVQFQRRELVTLERFHMNDHAYVSGVFRSLEIAEIDKSCLVSSKFWTAKDSDRDPGRRITLYEKQKDLPVYMLLESSWGYILFRPVDVYKVERNYMDIERYIEDFKRFFKFVASYTFASPDEALRYLTADNHDIVPDGLIDFLVRHLPKTMKDGNGNHCYTLALPNPFFAREIVKAGFGALSTSPFDVEIMRGVRRNIEKVFEKMKLEDLEQSQVYLAQIYGKQKLDSPNKGKAAPLPSFPTRKNPKRKVRE